jgi:hypothetical protein
MSDRASDFTRDPVNEHADDVASVSASDIANESYMSRYIASRHHHHHHHHLKGMKRLTTRHEETERFEEGFPSLNWDAPALPTRAARSAQARRSDER